MGDWRKKQPTVAKRCNLFLQKGLQSGAKFAIIKALQTEHTSRGRAGAARRAHNPEVGGSNPSPATKKKQGILTDALLLFHCRIHRTSDRRVSGARSTTAAGGGDRGCDRGAAVGEGKAERPPQPEPGTARVQANAARLREEVRILPPQPKMRTEKDIGSENPETTAVSGFFRAFF